MPSLFRVANLETNNGLWYSNKGELTLDIKKFDDLLCRDLPMKFDPEVAGGWFSATDNLPELDNWFPQRDRDILTLAGYGTYEYDVSEYRKIHNHVVFQQSAVIQVRRLF